MTAPFSIRPTTAILAAMGLALVAAPQAAFATTKASAAVPSQGYGKSSISSAPGHGSQHPGLHGLDKADDHAGEHGRHGRDNARDHHDHWHKSRGC